MYWYLKIKDQVEQAAQAFGSKTRTGLFKLIRISMVIPITYIKFGDHPEDKRIIYALQKWASKRPEVVRVLVYGSRVRGEQREDSDLDVAIELIKSNKGDTPFAIWLHESTDWQMELQSFVPWRLHLEWHDIDGKTQVVSDKISKDCYLAYEKET